jgi:hypothetical protein
MANRVRFTPDEKGRAKGGDTTVTIIVKNFSSYAARSPAVIVEFQDAVIPAGLFARVMRKVVAR